MGTSKELILIQITHKGTGDADHSMERISASEKAMNKIHEVKNVRFENDTLVMTVDGKLKRFALKKISYALYQALEKDRNRFIVSPSGYGIHWPSLDEDLSIDALLGIVHRPKVSEPVP